MKIQPLPDNFALQNYTKKMTYTSAQVIFAFLLSLFTLSVVTGGYNRPILSEINGYLEVITSSCEVIRACPLGIIRVRYPEIRVDVSPSDEVENLELNSPLLDMFCRWRTHELGCLGIEDISSAEVNTFVGRHTSPGLVIARCVERQTFGELHLEVELELRQLRDIILEEHGEVPSLLRRARDPVFLSDESLACNHRGEGDPTVRSGH